MVKNFVAKKCVKAIKWAQRGGEFSVRKFEVNISIMRRILLNSGLGWLIWHSDLILYGLDGPTDRITICGGNSPHPFTPAF